MDILKSKAQTVLEQLAIYKYLTPSQMLRLGIQKYKNNLYGSFAELERIKKPLIGKIDFGMTPKAGRLESYYYLTERGANTLAEQLDYNLEHIKYPKNTKSLFKNDYLHRKKTIDFNIFFHQWAEQQQFNILLDDYYFDTIGGNNKASEPLRSKNRIYIDQESYIIPDFVGEYHTGDRSVLFFAEIHQGKDTKRALLQLSNYARLFCTDQAQQKYSYNKNIKVFIITETDEAKHNIITRLQQDPAAENFKEFFCFKNYNYLTENFSENWNIMSLETRNFI